MNRTRAVVTTLALAFCAAAPLRLSAQVGADPSHSPYHDIRRGSGWTFAMGHLYGDGGPLRVGPNSGQTFAVRYDVRLSGLLQGFAEMGYLKGERMLLNPDDSVVHRFSGPIDAPVWTPMIGLQINLSGPKTWHGVAPFIAFGLGAAVGGDQAADTTQYQFGTKLLFTPSAGVRYYLGDRIHVRLEGSMYYWKLKYPVDWLNEPAAQPSALGEPSTAPIKGPSGLDDWVHTPSLRFGLGIAF
ncbi:MAG: hypothetical protein JF590_03095 [Gemmatimonadetes bacterium]|nr:hypothetical protein [Gemmatimonadota bacterium]